MYLYFQHSDGRYTLVADNVSDETVIENIHAHVESLNPNYRIHYIRSWDTPEGRKYDVGSWSEFYLLTQKPLEACK